MAHRRSKNKVFIMGNATQDFEFLSGTNNATSFTLVSNEVWKDRDSGEMMEKPEYHRCVAFGKSAEYLVNHGRKGSLVDLEGKLQTRKWQDQSGADRYTTEIVAKEVQIIDGWKTDSNQQKPTPAPAAAANNQGGAQSVPSTDTLNIPEGYIDTQAPGFNSQEQG